MDKNTRNKIILGSYLRNTNQLQITKTGKPICNDQQSIWNLYNNDKISLEDCNRILLDGEEAALHFSKKTYSTESFDKNPLTVNSGVSQPIGDNEISLLTKSMFEAGNALGEDDVFSVTDLGRRVRELELEIQQKTKEYKAELTDILTNIGGDVSSADFDNIKKSIGIIE